MKVCPRKPILQKKMVGDPVSPAYEKKKLFAVKDFAPIQFFTLVTSGGCTVDLRTNLTIQLWEFNFLSNAVFGFAVAIIVPEIMEVFRNVVRKS